MQSLSYTAPILRSSAISNEKRTEGEIPGVTTLSMFVYLPDTAQRFIVERRDMPNWYLHSSGVAATDPRFMKQESI
jgi:hypothetical protein